MFKTLKETVKHTYITESICSLWVAELQRLYAELAHSNSEILQASRAELEYLKENLLHKSLDNLETREWVDKLLYKEIEEEDRARYIQYLSEENLPETFLNLLKVYSELRQKKFNHFFENSFYLVREEYAESFERLNAVMERVGLNESADEELHLKLQSMSMTPEQANAVFEMMKNHRANFMKMKKINNNNQR